MGTDQVNVTSMFPFDSLSVAQGRLSTVMIARAAIIFARNDRARV